MIKKLSCIVLMFLPMVSMASVQDEQTLYRAVRESLAKWQELSDFENGPGNQSKSFVGYHYFHYCWIESDQLSSGIQTLVTKVQSPKLNLALRRMQPKLNEVFRAAAQEEYCDLIKNHMRMDDPRLPEIHAFIDRQVAAGPNRVRLAKVNQGTAAVVEFLKAVVDLLKERGTPLPRVN